MHNRVQIIQGGQFGSEAKGAIAAYLCQTEGIDYAVRTGATNAGHTVIYGGIAAKMQQLPVGWVNPATKLVIGAGSIVDLAILRREIAEVSMLTGEDVRKRLLIDHRATIHLPTAARASALSGRHHLIGATGKGCSEALMDRIRNRGTREMRLSRFSDASDLPFADTVRILNREFDVGAKIQLEGTQGTLLDLVLGPWPYTTHKQTLPGQWMNEAGLASTLPTEVVMVVRTMPIRVAGNSGPLPGETSWVSHARFINERRSAHGMLPLVREEAIQAFEQAVLDTAKLRRDRDAMPLGTTGLDLHLWTDDQRLMYRDTVSELHAEALKALPAATVFELHKLFEMTTVTKKLRRLAHLNVGQLAEASMLVRPHRTIITFMNYLFPELWHSTAKPTLSEKEFIDRISQITNSRVTHINRGPNPEHIIEVH